MTKETNFEHPPKGHLALLAYDSANDRWQAVHVDDSGNLQVDITAIVDGQIHLYAWDGDSWEKVTIDASGHLQVDVAAAVDLNAQNLHYDGSAWRKSNLLWGYNDRWQEQGSVTLASDNQILTCTAVPSGYVYVLEMAGMVNNTRQMTSVPAICILAGSAYHRAEMIATLAINTWLLYSHRVTLKEGDKVAFLFYGGLTGDAVVWQVWGYKMKIDM